MNNLNSILLEGIVEKCSNSETTFALKHTGKGGKVTLLFETSKEKTNELKLLLEERIEKGLLLEVRIVGYLKHMYMTVGIFAEHIEIKPVSGKFVSSKVVSEE